MFDLHPGRPMTNVGIRNAQIFLKSPNFDFTSDSVRLRAYPVTSFEPQFPHL